MATQHIVDQLVHAPGPQIHALSAFRAANRPVLIYGAGVYAYVVLGYLRALGIEVRAMVVDAAHREAARASGVEIRVLEEELGRQGDCAYVIGIAHHAAAQRRLESLGVTAALVVDVPDFLNMPAPFIDWAFVDAHRAELQSSYELLADELSRQTFVAALNAKLNQDPAFLTPVVRQDHLYFWRSEYPLRGEERLLDVGGFDGDSLRDFHALTGGRYGGVLSLEPFAPSYAQLQRVAAELDPGGSRIRTLPCGAWSEPARLAMAVRDMNIDNRIAGTGEHSIVVDTIDHIVAQAGFEASLIKMDINGAESHAIAGAGDCLRTVRPRLVAKLHVKEDFFRLPLLLKAIDPAIRIRIRQRNFMSMMLVLHASFED